MSRTLPERVRRLAGCAVALRQPTGAPRRAEQAAALERCLSTARQGLTPEAAAAAWAAGQAMSLEQAIAYVLEEAPTCSQAGGSTRPSQ